MTTLSDANRAALAATQLDAATIGRAAVSVVRDPARWRGCGSPAEVLVHLKDLWLLTVAHGRPAQRAAAASNRAAT